MSMAPRIFVGSSSEALELAQRIRRVIAEAHMEPVMWNTDAFRPGRTLLEEIENFPGEIHGAILLATPDMSCTRGSDDTFRMPTANIIFEYGYLGGRLTRDRVAVCRVNDAEMPSDAHGVKLIESKNIDLSERGLPNGFVAELKNWIARLPLLAAGISPTTQLHGYSGRWEVHNSFRTWRGVEIAEPNQVHFDGVAYLLIPPTGKSGHGVIYGASYASIDGYETSHYNVNDVLDATVGTDGDLDMTIEVKQRHVRYERGDPPVERLRVDLRDKKFTVSLRPDPPQARVLRGTHTYRQGLKLYSLADEEYTHKGY
jgi:hypothetical protein